MGMSVLRPPKINDHYTYGGIYTYSGELLQGTKNGRNLSVAGISLDFQNGGAWGNPIGPSMGSVTITTPPDSGGSITLDVLKVPPGYLWDADLTNVRTIEPFQEIIYQMDIMAVDLSGVTTFANQAALYAASVLHRSFGANVAESPGLLMSGVGNYSTSFKTRGAALNRIPAGYGIFVWDFQHRDSGNHSKMGYMEIELIGSLQGV